MRARRALVPSLLAVAAVALALSPRAALPLAGWLVGDSAVSQALAPAPGRGEPLTVLLIGSDTPQTPVGASTDPPERRADAVLLLQTVPAGARVQLLSLPRDLLVETDGGSHEQLAVAFQDGPAAIVDAVRRLTGLPIHHFFATDFGGFARVIDQLGGVALSFHYPARDRSTGFRVRAGRRLLDGTMALAYVRARTYEERVAGRWRVDPTGDLGRVVRQQRLLLALAHRTRGRAGPLGLLRLAVVLRGHVIVDRDLGGRAVELLRRLATAPEGVTARTLPVEPTIPPAARMSPFPPHHLGSFGYLRPKQPDATVMLAAFRAGRPLSPSKRAPT
jgi:LCP family protein required for cell wall assembly